MRKVKLKLLVSQAVPNYVPGICHFLVLGYLMPVYECNHVQAFYAIEFLGQASKLIVTCLIPSVADHWVWVSYEVPVCHPFVQVFIPYRPCIQSLQVTDGVTFSDAYPRVKVLCRDGCNRSQVQICAAGQIVVLLGSIISVPRNRMHFSLHFPGSRRNVLYHESHVRPFEALSVYCTVLPKKS